MKRRDFGKLSTSAMLSALLTPQSKAQTSSTSQQESEHAAAMTRVAADRRYELKGVIRSVNQAQKTAVIRHEKVGDYMEPMTMPFWIRDEKALNQLEARDQIVATLVVTKNKGEWLEEVFVVAKGR